MPTQGLCRLPAIAVLLTATLTAQAEDFHIKKNITVGGNLVSTTETSIKGARERTLGQSPTGNTLTLRQCDLKRTVTLNEAAQTYLVTEDPQDEAALKAAAMATGTPMAESAAYITETSSVTDTGERKIMFGYNTRHLKTTVTLESSKTACSQLSQKYEVDGWYVDLGKDIAGCQQALPPVRQVEGCNDRIIRHRSGSAKPAYPMTENVLIYNADGTTTTVGVATSQISKQNLEPELFDIPAGYRQVKSAAELNGAPPEQVAQQVLPAAAAAAQQPAAADKAAAKNQAKKNAAASVKPPTVQQMAAQQMVAQQAQMGMPSAAQALPAGMAGMGGMPAIGSMPGTVGAQQHASAPLQGTQALAAKPPGKVRIGVAPPEAQLGQGNNAGADYSTPIRNAVVTLMSGPAVEIVALDAHIAMQLQAEAVQKQCDFVMYSGVTVKHSSGGGFGKFMKAGSMAANLTPMGAMAHGMGGVAAAQAASMAASQMAQQQAISQLAGFNGQIKSKDDVGVEYQLVAPGQTTPLTRNSLKGKAKSDGEDVLTPLLQQAANDVLTQVTRK